MTILGSPLSSPCLFLELELDRTKLAGEYEEASFLYLALMPGLGVLAVRWVIVSTLLDSKRLLAIFDFVVNDVSIIACTGGLVHHDRVHTIQSLFPNISNVNISPYCSRSLRSHKDRYVLILATPLLALTEYSYSTSLNANKNAAVSTLCVSFGPTPP